MIKRWCSPSDGGIEMRVMKGFAPKSGVNFENFVLTYFLVILYDPLQVFYCWTDHLQLPFNFTVTPLFKLRIIISALVVMYLRHIYLYFVFHIWYCICMVYLFRWNIILFLFSFFIQYHLSMKILTKHYIYEPISSY